MLPRSTLNNIPEGFTIGVAPDGQQYLVPQYLVPALDQAFATYHSKMRLDVVQANPGVSDCIFIGASLPIGAVWPIGAGEIPSTLNDSVSSPCAFSHLKLPISPMY